MRIIHKYIPYCLAMAALASCEKLVTVPDPIDTVTTSGLFISDDLAKSAMAGLYTRMINDEEGGRTNLYFCAGNTTLLGALSADEMVMRNTATIDPGAQVNNNHLIAGNETSTNALWNSAYKVIYDANGIIEGIAASTSSRLTAAVRKRMTAEARFVRAFSYFYLTNLYGDLPLVLSIDFNITRSYAKTPRADIYKQIIEDLLVAQADLPPVNSNQAGERIYPSQWAATALLARVYLYTGEYEKAFKNANDVIGNLSDFTLETALDHVFLKDSREAIWQLKQNSNDAQKGNATNEGYFFIPEHFNTPFFNVRYNLSDQLMNAFESDDQRKLHWVGRSDNNPAARTLYFPYKYKTGINNKIIGAIPSEYYVVLRLAEQYLIRAEAAANGAADLSVAVADLNAIRHRADLDDLPSDLTQPEILTAIEQERRIELFAEWGHRWLDLKRSGKAGDVLSQIPNKQPWTGNFQLLYPIPLFDIQNNHLLKQNTGY